MIWGSDEDAVRAKEELDTFVHDVRTRGERPSRDHWTKEPAYDGRVEDRAMRKLREETLQAATYQLNQQGDLQFEALLLWPEKLDVKDFRSKHEDTVLRKIQSEIECRIEFCPKHSPRYVKISSNEERHVHSTHTKVINLIRETTAQDGMFLRVNRIRLPNASMYRDRVSLHLHPSKRLYMPTLYGNPLPEGELGEWSRLQSNSELSNNTQLKRELESVIRAIQAPSQHVRMRVALTELGFRRYEAPPDAEEHHREAHPDSEKHYVFDDFSQMMVKPLVKIDMVGLNSHANLGGLVDIISAMPEFSNLENRFRLQFDFRGDSKSALRYEREMRLGFEDELEDEANRWLRFGGSADDKKVLEFNVLDFEHLRANYVVLLEKTEFHEPQDQHRKFASGIQYQHEPTGVKSKPLRRAIFPPGYDGLAEHHELSIARWNFKGPDARFELIRRDTFRGIQSGKTPTESEWLAHYYYPEWDTLLGEFGNLEPGDQVSWKKSLETFFPPENRSSDIQKPLPSFKKFVQEISEAQKCLQKAIGILELGADEGETVEGFGAANSVNGVTNGIKGMTVR
jgi:hypothetical protein